ncbi:MAG: hypothetical protein K0R17_2675 [Rariglobus sp.]|jgi:hypothetical protein|nr:hypothetical protein [Rariglobus sp.]
MNHLFRIVALACLSVPAVLSAAAPARPEPTRELVAVSITGTMPPEMFYRDAATGNPVPFRVGLWSAGPVMRIGLASEIELYKQAKDEKGNPIMIPATRLTVPQGKPEAEGRLLLVFHLDAQGRTTYRALAADVAGAPSGSVRFFNLSEVPVIYRLNNDVATLAVGQSAVSGKKFTTSESFKLAYGLENPGEGIYRSNTVKLYFPRDDMRLIVLFGTLPEEVTDANGHTKQLLQIRDARIYERVPVARPPAPQVAAMTRP